MELNGLREQTKYKCTIPFHSTSEHPVPTVHILFWIHHVLKKKIIVIIMLSILQVNLIKFEWIEKQMRELFTESLWLYIFVKSTALNSFWISYFIMQKKPFPLHYLKYTQKLKLGFKRQAQRLLHNLSIHFCKFSNHFLQLTSFHGEILFLELFHLLLKLMHSLSRKTRKQMI